MGPYMMKYNDTKRANLNFPSIRPVIAYRLAETYLIAADGTSKSIFRQAMRGIVPDSILDRRDKIGFATPEQRWLSTLRPWVDEVLRSGEQSRIPVLNMPALKQEWQEILAGSRSFDFRVWRWLNVIRWAEKMGVGF